MADLKKWSQSEISRMRSDMDRLFDDLCSDFDLPVMSCRIAGDLDLRQEGDVLVARFELGTISPDDVEVSVLDRRLIIQAECIEVGYGRSLSETYRKEIKLPCVIRPDEVEANYSDGILEVRLPKSSSQLGQRIRISRK